MQIIEKVNTVNNGKELVSPIRQLLATMYKVLVLADSVIVKEIIQAKDKVIIMTYYRYQGVTGSCLVSSILSCWLFFHYCKSLKLLDWPECLFLAKYINAPLRGVSVYFARNRRIGQSRNYKWDFDI